MLREDGDVALNEVLVACRQVADHCRQAAELVDRAGLQEIFRRLAHGRHSDADRVEDLVRRYGWLPEEPRRDKQDIARLITRTRAAVANDEEDPLMEKARDLEAALEDKVIGALRLEWQPETVALLRELAAGSRRHREGLAAGAA
jgi:hypothetical protein